MTRAALTINPEDVRDPTAVGMPGGTEWLAQVAEYVTKAAASGETVTLTSKRRMMTPEQVAEYLGVSRSTVSRRIKAGDLRAVKVGNRNRIPFDEFERFWRESMGELVELTREDLREDLFGGQ